MSDYLTRLIERSVGMEPQIKPLIEPINAPMNAPPGLMSETVETAGPFESSDSLKTETSERAAPQSISVEATSVPVVSRAETQAPRASGPLSESQAEFPIEKKDDRSYPTESRPIAASRQASPAPPNKAALEITAAAPSPNPPLSHDTRTVVSQRKIQIVVQPESIRHLKPTASPLVVLQPSPKESPVINVTIGRVEVRAIYPQPESAVRHPPLSPPKMSLDDYLRSRNGGAA